MPLIVKETHPVSVSTDRPPHFKIALITSFPPSLGDLNEYGYHLARALRNDPRVKLTILADEISPKAELPGFDIQRCWRFDCARNLVSLMRAIWRTNPDVIWFNMGFSTFARSPLAAFLGITIPALARLVGFYTHVTLHTVFEQIDLEDAGLRWKRIYRIGGHLATRLLLMAHDITVLLPSFRSTLVNNYHINKEKVHFRPHGVFADLPDTTITQYQLTENVILAFGYWGTYKRVEPLLQAIDEVSKAFPDAMLVIAGKNHPSKPGYLELLQKQCINKQNVRFVGYVREPELRDLFNTATVLALPYSSAAGASGVVHQGCQYGIPMVAADIAEIRESALAEGIVIDFYPPGDTQALAMQLTRLLQSPELRRDRKERNLLVSRTMEFSKVTAEYLTLFQHRVGISTHE
jgi:glycosyltransferase involved in cell wall biosynthesis